MIESVLVVNFYLFISTRLYFISAIYQLFDVT